MRAAPHRSSADRDAALRWDFLPTTHLKNYAEEEKREGSRRKLGKQESSEGRETGRTGSGRDAGKGSKGVRRKDER